MAILRSQNGKPAATLTKRRGRRHAASAGEATTLTLEYYVGDVLLPSQARPGMPPLTPERRLLLALVEDAVKVLRKYRNTPAGKDRDLFVDTVLWFTEPRGTAKLSFEPVCGHLWLDPAAVRSALQRRLGITLKRAKI